MTRFSVKHAVGVRTPVRTMPEPQRKLGTHQEETCELNRMQGSRKAEMHSRPCESGGMRRPGAVVTPSFEHSSCQRDGIFVDLATRTSHQCRQCRPRPPGPLAACEEAARRKATGLPRGARTLLLIRAQQKTARSWREYRHPSGLP